MIKKRSGIIRFRNYSKLFIERGAIIISEPLIDQIITTAQRAEELYYRLVLVVNHLGTGKTQILQEISNRLNVPLLNINLEISRLLLNLTERQRSIQLPYLLRNLVGELNNSNIILDNLEILFDSSLKQDPLSLLKSISRNKTIIASWNGSIENDYLVYAKPNHPEYRKYPVEDIQVIVPESTKLV